MFKRLNLITINFISVLNKIIVDAKDDIKLRTGVVDISKTEALRAKRASIWSTGAKECHIVCDFYNCE